MQTLKTVQTLITSGLLSEADLTAFVNSKLEGIALVGSENTTAKPAKTVKTPKSKPVKAKAEKRERVVKEYGDGRKNNHAILLAINSFDDGCSAEQLQAKLKEMDHEMEARTFFPVMSVLKSKDQAIKTSGKKGDFTYKLTSAGKKYLAEYEASEAEATAEVTDTVAE